MQWKIDLDLSLQILTSNLNLFKIQICIFCTDYKLWNYCNKIKTTMFVNLKKIDTHVMFGFFKLSYYLINFVQHHDRIFLDLCCSFVECCYCPRTLLICCLLFISLENHQLQMKLNRLKNIWLQFKDRLFVHKNYNGYLSFSILFSLIKKRDERKGQKRGFFNCWTEPIFKLVRFESISNQIFQ